MLLTLQRYSTKLSARDPYPVSFTLFFSLSRQMRGKCLKPVTMVSAHTRWVHINVVRVNFWWTTVFCRVFRVFPRPYRSSNALHALDSVAEQNATSNGPVVAYRLSYGLERPEFEYRSEILSYPNTPRPPLGSAQPPLQ